MLQVAPRLAHLHWLLELVHQPSCPGAACPAGVQVMPWFQLQISVPHAVPPAVQSVSFVHCAADAGTVHPVQSETTIAAAARTLDFMATPP